MIFLITLEGFKLPARAEPHDYICLPCPSPHPDKLLVTVMVFIWVLPCYYFSISFTASFTPLLMLLLLLGQPPSSLSPPALIFLGPSSCSV